MGGAAPHGRATRHPCKRSAFRAFGPLQSLGPEQGRVDSCRGLAGTWGSTVEADKHAAEWRDEGQAIRSYSVTLRALLASAWNPGPRSVDSLFGTPWLN